jgi:hypothetical protein
MVAGKAELKPLIMKPEGDKTPPVSPLERDMYVKRGSETLPARHEDQGKTRTPAPR